MAHKVLLSVLVADGLTKLILLCMIFCDGCVQAEDKLTSAFRHLFSRVAQKHVCIKEDKFSRVNLVMYSERDEVTEVYLVVALSFQASQNQREI